MKNIILFSSIFTIAFAVILSFTVNKKIVVIDAGHGGNDHGAVVNEIYEKDVVKDIAHLIQSKNKDENVKIILTRDGDEQISLVERVQLMVSANPTMVISLHLNNFSGKSEKNGTEIFIQNNDRSKLLGEKLAAHFDNCIISERNLYILKNSEVPTVMLELGNMSNDDELNYMKSNIGKQEISRKILKFISEN